MLTGIIEEQDEVASVKQEECSQFYYEEIPPQFITYEQSNLSQIVSSLLLMNEEEVDHIARTQPLEFELLMIKAKRKLYRDKARLRMQILRPNICHISQPQEPKKAKRGRKPLNQEKVFVDDNSDHDKKTIQMIRNRISAQNSRDRKKAYLKEMEEKRDILIQDNEKIVKQIEELSNNNQEIEQQNENIQKCLQVFMQQCIDSGEKDALELVQALQQFE